MDIEKKKQILNNYRHLDKELEETYYNYLETRLKLTAIDAQIIDDMPKSAPITFDKIGEGLARLDDLKIIRNKILNERIRIEKAISKIQNSVERRIIIMRYMQYLTFEEIAVMINFTWRHTHRLHSNALRNIKL